MKSEKIKCKQYYTVNGIKLPVLWRAPPLGTKFSGESIRRKHKEAIGIPTRGASQHHFSRKKHPNPKSGNFAGYKFIFFMVEWVGVVAI